MLTVLFVIAALVFGATMIRRPRNLHERVAAWVSGILMLAVIVAWGVEYVVSNARAADGIAHFTGPER